MRKISSTILMTFLSTFLLLAQTDLEKHLFEMPDVIFTKIETPEGYQAAYKLMIKQPLDHTNPSEGYFYQKVYYSHMGYDHPTAIITNGYSKGGDVYLTKPFDNDELVTVVSELAEFG